MSITQTNRSDQISDREQIVVDMAQTYYPGLYHLFDHFYWFVLLTL